MRSRAPVRRAGRQRVPPLPSTLRPGAWTRIRDAGDAAGRRYAPYRPSRARAGRRESAVVRDVDGLKRKAEEGRITAAELAQVVAAIEGGAGGAHLVQLLGVVGRARRPDDAPLVARFLGRRDDPDVAAWALHVLGTQWRRLDLVRDHLLAALHGLEWDASGDVRSAAVTAAGVLLADHRDPELLAALLDVVEGVEDPWDVRDGGRALATALGDAPHVTVPVRVELPAWSAALQARARERLTRERAGWG